MSENTTTNTSPRPYWNSYWAGLLLGLVLLMVEAFGPREHKSALGFLVRVPESTPPEGTVHS